MRGLPVRRATLGACALLACSRADPPAPAPAVSVDVEASPPSAAPSARVPAPLFELDDAEPTTLGEQRARLFVLLERHLGYDAARLARLRDVFEASPVLGQGSPRATVHPLTRSACRERRAAAHVLDTRDPHCPQPYMSWLGPGTAACIDRYEFPGVPCEYPVTWVSAREANLLCRAVDKRLCDAHEWEGACAGEVRPVADEYDFKKPRMEGNYFHNHARAVRWAYGASKDHARCATGSKKSPKCDVISFQGCGSNSYPAGSFPECVSPLGVFDQHGNVAEHMSFPESAAQLTSQGGLGQTEMKGSWFIFQSYEAHDDDCRWRAPAWHVTPVDSPISHLNYHLGFRCCSGATE